MAEKVSKHDIQQNYIMLECAGFYFFFFFLIQDLNTVKMSRLKQEFQWDIFQKIENNESVL